ncbi:MAG: transposase, partial [Prevotella sp.]|nr:transposase [Prevotella sp.]
MNREVYESQRHFAGEKKPSMQRRCVDHDYSRRMMYMITMVTEGRRPLFGRVTERSDAPADSDEAPRIELTELGKRVEACWHEIVLHHPQIEVIALQMMPDHLHGILFVREALD